MRDVSTSLDMTKGLLEDRRTLWILAALIVVLFVIANLPWQLDDYDQAKQAFTSFEMVKEGHWFYQHTPGVCRRLSLRSRSQSCYSALLKKLTEQSLQSLQIAPSD
jgi:hypothetical protein